MKNSINDKATMREVSRELRPDWSDEQFEAHWEDYVKLRWAVARGRRKHTAKLSRTKRQNAKMRDGMGEEKL
jgi:hypothetical protein